MVTASTVGVVGLGNMGSSVASRLAATARVLAYDPAPSPAARQLADSGRIELVDDPGSVAAAGAVVLSLPTPAISHATIARLAPLLGTGVIIETSTVSPRDMRASAEICAPHGTRLVDAAILAGVQPMLDGAAVLLVGGDPSDIDSARPVLEAFSSEVVVLGDLGAGMAAKVINNAVAHAVMVVLAEAGALAAANGIPRSRLADLLASRDGGLIRPLEHRFRERILHGDFQGGMPTDAARKDSTLALGLAQSDDVPLFAIQGAHTVYELALADGLAKQDYSAIATLWEKWTGRALRDEE